MTVSPSLTSPHPYDWIDDVIYIIDADGRIVFANTCTLKLWGKQLHEVLGHALKDILPHAAAREVQDAFRHALMTQRRTEFDTYGVRLRGWINVTLHPHEGGLIVHVKSLPRNADVRTPDTFDALTGCLTRTAFQRAQQALNFPHILAILDLNLLKNVNTLRGHSGGDTHIRTIAHTVQEALPTDALMCRWGGDEFVILTPGQDQDSFQKLLEKTNEVLPGPAPGVLAFATGMSVWEQGTAFEQAFAVADERLQLNKEQLRNGTPGEHEAHALVLFSQELETLRDPSDLIQHALNRLLTLLDFDQTVYAPWDGQDNYISHQAVREGVAPPEPTLHVRMPIAQSGLVSRVRQTQTTAWSTDYTTEPTSNSTFVRQGIRSAIVTPVFSQGKIIATLVLRAVNRWQTITPHMRKVVELTALRLEHALELLRAVGEVRSTLEAGMLTLGLVLEARDSDTQGHTNRATGLTEQLGERFGLNADALDHLRQGAYLHDLGKLSIPDEILRKPGRLTPQEWVIMQSHVTKGYDLAVRIPGLPQGVLDIIRSHHERWDGSGYPDALSGTDIPLNARLFAVCDVYDALISVRPYKEAWSHEDATAEITRQSGRHFDPDVVRAFLDLTRHRPDSRQELPEMVMLP